MAGGKKRISQRVILPNGAWVNIYADGSIALNAYHLDMRLSDFAVRKTGSTVEFKCRDNGNKARPVATKNTVADLRNP